MANKMLIDAAHPEETRVVVLRGHRVEEFDFEAANKKQLRGNIYLAKVTRVEPSLQAAFIDYGGNRHGFLAFSEIHPDYYQIPMSDRQALIDADAADEAEEEEQRRPRRSRRRRGGEKHAAARRAADESVSENAESQDDEHADELVASDQGPRADGSGAGDHDQTAGEMQPVERDAADKPPYDDVTPELIDHASAVHQGETTKDTPETEAGTESKPAAPSDRHDTPTSEQPAALVAEATGDPTESPHVDGADDDAHVASDAEIDTGSRSQAAEHADRAHDEDDDDSDDNEEDEDVEHLGGDAMEELPVRSYRPRRQYKIQEVIKRRQILLVQVVKEERGNKGAALTTYLSLAGRYSVLMPNTARGGGISRKITDAGDRQRLKTIAQDLEVPDGMGVILRTAGAARTKPEVKRDFEYLMRMWETVREATLQSSAPTLVYEEGSLIKRAIRDLYNKDVDEVIVAGEDGYREAKDFMRLLMPSHAKNVQPWRESQPIFAKAGAEAQLDAMFSNHVTLKSGGYIVINQTEALVAIDVNSGRSTREHNIEDTALRTNLEASDEIARQLRLRDLAGLIVVDFIDMEENRNNRAVERRMKDALKNDRARIQIGRISHFGLLEMSRQRIRTGVLEGSTVVCDCCAGSGTVRSTASVALHVLRLLEDALIADPSRNIVVRTRGIVALYVLNQKRAHLADLEARFGASITVESDESLTGTTYCAIERTDPATGVVQPMRHIPIYEPELDDPAVVDEAEGDEDEPEPNDEAGRGGPADTRGRAPQDEDGEPRRKRRRRRGRGRDRESSGISEDAPQPADDALAFVTDVEGARAEESDDASDESADGGNSDGEAETGDNRGPRRRRSRRGGRRAREARERQGAADGEAPTSDTDDAQASERSESREPTETPTHEPEPEQPRPPAPETRGEAKSGAAPSEAADPVVAAPAAAAEPEAPSAPARPEPVSSELDPSRPKRSGWWQKAKATLGG